jgi:hypothetical protein
MAATDRQQTIDKAIDALESGTATPTNGQDPQALADTLRTGSERGSLGNYAAFKTAQRILANS